MPKAKYKTILENILKKISEGKLLPGNRIESIREMCEHYAVSPIVALRVFKELAETGKVERRDGEGYFVKLPAPPGQGNKIISLFRPSRDYNRWDNLGNRINDGILSATQMNHLHLIIPGSTVFMKGKIPSDQEVRMMAEEIGEFRNAVGIVADMRITDEQLHKYILPAAGGTPVAVIGRSSQLPHVLSCSFPYEAVGRDAAKLALTGKPEYIFHFPDKGFPDSHIMTKAFTDYLKKQNFPEDKVLIRNGYGILPREECYRMFEEIMRCAHRSPGRVFVFCTVDTTAEAIRSYCNMTQDAVYAGKDYSLIGFGGYEVVKTRPDRTATFEVDFSTLGSEAVRLLIECKTNLDQTSVTIPYKLSLNETIG